jgi:hypothetical protein
MLKPLQQGLMAIHLALQELALPHRIAAFEGNVVLKDFGGTAPMPGAHIQAAGHHLFPGCAYAGTHV